jgi:Outer membrane protein beta-barrel domain
MRIRALVGIGVLHTALLAPPARAEGVRDRGPELALRLGLALPAGSINDGTHLDSYASSAVPVILEGGYRLDANLFLGARFQYAFPQVKNPNGSCSGNTSCSGSVVTLGVEGTYRFLPEQTFAPWLGLGFGYEWASAEADAPNGGLGATNKGFQVLAQGGGDVRVNEHLVLGPFVEAAFGRYESTDGWLRLGNATTSSSADITNTAWHTWITFGVRGAFGF